MILQRTIKKAITLTGIGIHSGREIRLSIKPGRPNQGVVFVRTDLKGKPAIPAHYKNVVSTTMATTLGVGDTVISTVEHVLAALYGAGIDNAIIEVNSQEIPIMDGSSVDFSQAIAEVGTESQLMPRAYLVLRNRVEVRVGEKWAVAEPASSLQIHATIDFDHPSIGFQEFHFVDGKSRFEDLSNARTFGFLRDYEALKKAGLARGGSLANAVVLDDVLVLNEDGLRSPDEFVRHKVLDALGDLMLAGMSMKAYVRLHRAGHDLHKKLLAAIFADPNNYEIIHGTMEQSDRKVADAIPLLAARTRFAATY